jgi:hypothetical protein
MKDEVLGTATAHFRVRTAAPCVVRLPDGHVQMTGDSARFPETCPRCGSSPANTCVKLRVNKARLAKLEQASIHVVKPAIRVFKGNIPSIKFPFCRRCGWTLKITQFLPAILGGAVISILDPLIHNFRPRQVPWFSAGTAFFAGMMTAGLITALFEYMPRLFINPGVKVVAATKDSVELVFDDLMYAEKFVLLNR